MEEKMLMNFANCFSGIWENSGIEFLNLLFKTKANIVFIFEAIEALDSNKLCPPEIIQKMKTQEIVLDKEFFVLEEEEDFNCLPNTKDNFYGVLTYDCYFSQKFLSSKPWRNIWENIDFVIDVNEYNHITNIFYKVLNKKDESIYLYSEVDDYGYWKRIYFEKELIEKLEETLTPMEINIFKDFIDYANYFVFHQNVYFGK